VEQVRRFRLVYNMRMNEPPEEFFPNGVPGESPGYRLKTSCGEADRAADYQIGKFDKTIKKYWTLPPEIAV